MAGGRPQPWGAFPSSIISNSLVPRAMQTQREPWEEEAWHREQEMFLCTLEFSQEVRVTITVLCLWKASLPAFIFKSFLQLGVLFSGSSLPSRLHGDVLWLNNSWYCSIHVLYFNRTKQTTGPLFWWFFFCNCHCASLEGFQWSGSALHNRIELRYQWSITLQLIVGKVWGFFCFVFVNFLSLLSFQFHHQHVSLLTP